MLSRTAKELAVALDMFAPDQQLMSGGWEEAIEALEEVVVELKLHGLPIPSVIDNVLRRSTYGSEGQQ